MDTDISSIPIVTVLMPVFNAQSYLDEAIKSILDQTFINFEFLIINDGSTDLSEKIILSFDDPRIIYKCNKTNCGIVATLNEGLSCAKGKYIARMDADDIAKPTRLFRQFDFMEKNPEIFVLGTGFEQLVEGKTNEYNFLPETDCEIKKGLFFCSQIAHPTVMFNKSKINKFNLQYNKDAKYAEDYELWVKAANLGFKFHNLQSVELTYRSHSNQISKQYKIEQELVTKSIRKAYFFAYFNEINNLIIDKIWQIFVNINITKEQYIIAKENLNILNNSTVKNNGSLFISNYISKKFYLENKPSISSLTLILSDTFFYKELTLRQRITFILKCFIKL